LASAHAAAAAQAKKQGDLQEAARQRRISRTAAESTAAQSERNRLQREAAAAIKSTATAQELYNQRILDYGRFLRGGAISQKQFVELAKRSKAELLGAAQAQSAAFGSGAIAQLRNYVLGVGGVMTAVMVARQEYEEFKSSVERRAQSQITMAAANKGLAFAAIGLPPGQGDNLQGIASQISADTGLSPVDTAVGLRKMLAVNPDVQRAEQYLRFGGKAMAGMDNAADTMTSILQVGNALGKRTSAQEAYGYFGTVATFSNVANEEQLARNLVRTMQGYKSYGINPNIGASVLNAYSNALADPYGEVSRTAALNLPVAVDKLFADKKMMKRLGVDPSDYDTSEERIRLVLNNARGLGAAFNQSAAGQAFGAEIAAAASGSGLPNAAAFQEAVIAAGSSRGASIGGVRGTLLGGSETAQDALVNTMKALDNRGGVLQTGSDVRTRLEAAAGEDTADFNRMVGATETRMNMLGRPALTTEGVSALENIVRTYRNTAGLTTEGNSWRRFFATGGESNPEDTAAFIQSQIDEAQRPSLNPAVPNNPAMNRGAAFNDADREMRNLLEQINAGIQRQAAAAEGANRKAPATSRQE
jgi:hypothetical protein